MTHFHLPSFRVVVWDADGTLYNSPPVSIRKHQDVAGALGLRVPTTEELRSIWHKPWKDILREVWGSDAPRFKAAYSNIYYTLTYPPFDGLADTILLLHDQGVLQSILTNRDAASCGHRIAHAGLPVHVFQAIDGIEDRTYHKPHPQAFDRLWTYLAREGLDLTDVVYVGDTVGDAAFARAVGCAFIGVATFVSTRDEFLAAGVHPDFILDTPRDVRKFF